MGPKFLHRFFERSSPLLLVLLVIGLISCNRFNQSYNEIPKLPDPKEDLTSKHLEIVNKLIEDDDENDGLYWQQSILLQKLGKPEESLSAIRKAIELEDSKYHYYKTLAQAYVLNNKFDSAISAATYSRNSGNDDYQLNLILAEAYLNNGKIRESLKEVEHALKIDNKNYYAYYLRGMAFKALKDTLKYQEDFSRAMNFKPDDKKVYKEIMNFYLSRKQSAQAKNILDVMFSRFTPDSTMLRQKGEYFESQNKLDSAYALYGSALSRDSSQYYLSLRMGDIKLITKDYINASKHFSDVLKYSKNNFEAQYKQAICFESLRNYMEAISGFEKALGMDTANEVVKKDILRVNSKVYKKQEQERQRKEEQQRPEPLPELPNINQ